MGSSTLSLDWHGIHRAGSDKPIDMLIAGNDRYRVQGRYGDVRVQSNGGNGISVTGSVRIGDDQVDVAMVGLNVSEVNALISYIKGEAGHDNEVVRRSRRILRIRRMRESFHVGTSEDGGVSVPVYSGEGVCVGYVCREASDEYGEQWVALDALGNAVSKGLSQGHAINELARFYCENLN